MQTDRERIIEIAEQTLNAGKAVSDYFESDCYTVYVTDGGFCAIMQNLDSADLLDIAVLPEKRGEGRASSLMEFMIDDLKNKGVTQIFLEVRKSNESAIALYKKFGFEKISERKNYYSEPKEDALIYRREL